MDPETLHVLPMPIPKLQVFTSRTELETPPIYWV